jgi:hypothetical protein
MVCVGVAVPMLLPATPAQSAVQGIAPAILFTDVESGSTSGGPNNQGVPISIFGKGFGATRGSSRVTIGGVEVASYLVWGENNAHNPHLDMIVVQPGANVTGGSIVVSVNNVASNASLAFAVNTGKVYAIALNGSDSNACEMATPCATISHVATNLMQPGDTVLLRGGEYAESEIWIRGNYGDAGTLANRNTIKNYPGEEVTLSNAARPFILDADYVTVSGINFLNGKSLGIAGWADVNQKGNKLVNNTFKGQIDYEATGSHGNDHVLAGNVCEVSGSSVGTQGHCYYISYGNNVKVIYNIGSGAPGYGIHVFDQRRGPNDFKRVISNLLVEGNILKGSTNRSGMIIAMGDEDGLGNTVENVVVRNNIFTANNHAGLQVQAIGKNVQVHNNTFYQNGLLGLYIGSGATSQVDIRNNLIFQDTNTNCQVFCSWFTPSQVQSAASAGSVSIVNNSYHGMAQTIVGGSDASAVTGAVQFVDAAALNFRPLAGSSNIDKGALNTSTVPQDFDGQARPQGSGVDTGAFEFISGTTQIATPTATTTSSPQTQTPTPTLTQTPMMFANQWVYLPLVLR